MPDSWRHPNSQRPYAGRGRCHWPAARCIPLLAHTLLQRGCWTMHVEPRTLHIHMTQALHVWQRCLACVSDAWSQVLERCIPTGAALLSRVRPQGAGAAALGTWQREEEVVAPDRCWLEPSHRPACSAGLGSRRLAMRCTRPRRTPSSLTPRTARASCASPRWRALGIRRTSHPWAPPAAHEGGTPAGPSIARAGQTGV